MTDKVAVRREAKVAAIVDAAWKLAREHGIAGVSLHALAREVGIRQPSLYAYFDSKHALYDAMFADGNRQLLERLDALKLPRDPRAAVKKFMRTFVGSRSRTRPAARCSSSGTSRVSSRRRESYALAEEVLGRAVALLHDAGVTRAGRHRLLRRHGRRAHRSANQQRPRRQPLDPPSQPPRRHATSTTPTQGGTHDEHRRIDRIERPEARVLAEEEFGASPSWWRRSRPTSGRLPTDCTGMGRPQGGAARARLRPTRRRRSASSCTSSGAACRSTRRSTRTTGSTA